MTEKFRLVLSLAEIDTLIEVMSKDIDIMMENITLVNYLSKYSRRAKADAMSPNHEVVKTHPAQALLNARNESLWNKLKDGEPMTEQDELLALTEGMNKEPDKMTTTQILRQMELHSKYNGVKVVL